MTIEDEKLLYTEDLVFTLLSHPLRRDILKSIYDNGYTTFSEIKSNHKVSTGAIYHHLDSLSPVLEQNGNNHYLLNEIGKEICKKYLETEKGRITIQKYSSLVIWTSKIDGFVKSNKTVLVLLSIITSGILFVLSFKYQYLAIGPIIVNFSETNFLFHHYSIFIISNLLLLGLYHGLFILFTSGHSETLKLSFTTITVLVAILPSVVLVLVTVVIALFGVFINSGWWIAISMISQFSFHVLIYSQIVNVRRVKPEKALILTILPIYLTVSILSII